MNTIMETLSYAPSELVKFFHSFPRYDIKFSPVSSQFNPDDKQYQESLLLIAAVPVMWMLLWILIYMVYFCYFCVTCRRQNIEKARKSVRPTRWCSFFFTILIMLVVLTSIFSNELVNYSLKAAESDFSKINNGTDAATVQSVVIRRSLDVLNNETVAYLKSEFRRNPRLDENDRPAMIGHGTILTESLLAASQYVLQGLQEPLMQVEMDSTKFSSLLEEYEIYRRIATGALAGFLILTSALSLCALGRKNKAFLLACVAISIFNLMIVWVGAGFYAGLAVATSDFCMDPTDYLAGSSDSSPGTLLSERYYLECEPAVNPLYETVVLIQDEIDKAETSLATLSQRNDVLSDEVLQNISDAQRDLRTVKTRLLTFSTATDCSSPHRYYMSALVNICQTSVIGEAAILGSFSSAGIFLIILVFLIHTAARFNSNRRAYYEVDSQDIDYQSRGENTRSDNPLYYRFSQISTNEDNTRVPVATSSASASVQPTAPPRSSPPPAYQNHKDFYSTYGNNGTLDSNTRVPAASNDLNRNSNTFRT